MLNFWGLSPAKNTFFLMRRVYMEILERKSKIFNMYTSYLKIQSKVFSEPFSFFLYLAPKKVAQT